MTDLTARANLLRRTARVLAPLTIFACTLPAVAGARGLESPVKTIYLIAHPHLDIGYTDPPQVVEEVYKKRIDEEIAFTQAHPDYKWNIEETWQLRQWLSRSSTSETQALMRLIRDGRIGLAGGHSTLHSGKAGIEELNRYVYDAEALRREYGVLIRTVFHNDSPGLPWSYPQLLEKSGFRYLVTGLNLFIGGGFDAPYHPYLYWWEGPDGSRILTWTTWSGYYEAHHHYGFRARERDFDRDRLKAALNDMVTSGYPFDAVMVQASSDNDVNRMLSQRLYEAAQKWNREEGAPRMVMARPEDFFAHVMARKPKLPVLKGSWDSPWDTMQMIEPQSEKATKNAQDLLPSTEKAWAFAAALGSDGYPAKELARAWDDALVIDEHSGADGLAKRGGATREETDATGDYFQQKLDSLLGAMRSAGDSGAAALFSHVKVEEPSIVVFNPLSWRRTEVVEAPLSAESGDAAPRVVDPQTGADAPAQVILRNGARFLAFEAVDVPSLGLKRYAMRTDDAVRRPAGGSVAAASVENSLFRVEAAPDGTIKSLYDKTANKELVSPHPAAFGSMVRRNNSDFFMAAEGIRVDAGSSVTVTVGMDGPVQRSLIIRREGSPLPQTEVILTDGRRRVDIVATVDRDEMATATMADNALVHSLAFPFDLPGAVCRLDTPAGWLDPGRDMMKGADLRRFNVHHGVTMSQGDYSLTLVSPDVYTQEIRPPVPADAEPTQTVILSTFLRKVDELELKGKAVGHTRIEAGMPRQWQLRHSILPRTGGFDAVKDERAGWEAGTPMVARVVPAADGSVALDKPVSLLSVDAPSVMIYAVKAPESGGGMIVKLREISGTSTRAVLSSDALSLAGAREANLVERDTGPKLTARAGRLPVRLGANELKNIRLQAKPSSPGNRQTEARRQAQ